MVLQHLTQGNTFVVPSGRSASSLDLFNTHRITYTYYIHIGGRKHYIYQLKTKEKDINNGESNLRKETIGADIFLEVTIGITQIDCTNLRRGRGEKGVINT